MTRESHLYYLRRARDLATASDDPWTKVGVVIACPGIGLARFPSLVLGVSHTPVHIPARRVMKTMPRDENLELVIHAEMAAICNAAAYGDKLWGSTLYMVAYGVRAGVYGGSMPCLSCARYVIAAGIKQIVTIAEPLPRSESADKARALLEEAGILCTEIDYTRLAD